jgi:hypothetical protein
MTLALEITNPAGIRTRRWLALGLMFSVLLLPVLVSWLGPVPPEQLRYASAIAGVLHTDRNKESSGTPTEVKLPDAWNQTRRGFGGLVEYVVELRPIDRMREQSVLI